MNKIISNFSNLLTLPDMGFFDLPMHRGGATRPAAYKFFNFQWNDPVFGKSNCQVKIYPTEAKNYFGGKLWWRQQFEKFGSLWLANTKIDISRELFEIWRLLRAHLKAKTFLFSTRYHTHTFLQFVKISNFWSHDLWRQ